VAFRIEKIFVIILFLGEFPADFLRQPRQDKGKPIQLGERKKENEEGIGTRLLSCSFNDCIFINS